MIEGDFDVVELALQNNKLREEVSSLRKLVADITVRLAGTHEYQIVMELVDDFLVKNNYSGRKENSHGTGE